MFALSENTTTTDPPLVVPPASSRFSTPMDCRRCKEAPESALYKLEEHRIRGAARKGAGGIDIAPSGSTDCSLFYDVLNYIAAFSHPQAHSSNHLTTTYPRFQSSSKAHLSSKQKQRHHVSWPTQGYRLSQSPNPAVIDATSITCKVYRLCPDSPKSSVT
ncbi:hypothetical protein TgHK011_000282 [Trichoderma gracile]|nr:hypothetical protein TgHK011_000282 [Trichoderma gracile]